MPRWNGRILTALVVTVSVAGWSAADDPAPSPRPGEAPHAAAGMDLSGEKANPLESPPGLTPAVKLRGRIEVDAVMVVQSEASKALLGDLQNGYGFRRARLGAQGTVGSSALWVAEIDFAGGDVQLRDMFVGLTALPGVRQVRVGHFREPFSLEGATSSNFITFLERSPLNQLDPTRNWGVAGYWWPDGERLTFALGAFRDDTTSAGLSVGDDDAWAVTTRLTWLPVYEDRGGAYRLVHVGAAFSQRRPAGGVVQYNLDPQSNLLMVPDNPPSPFLPGVDVPASGQQLYNLQAAGIRGPLSIQGEWFGSAIQQKGAGVVFLHGFYAYASYFLTGEHRGYDRQRGAFDRVAVRRPLVRSEGAPASGFGAVELAARFAVADYASGNLPVPSAPARAIPGAVVYEATFGVNWYLNDHTRVMANYTLAVPDVGGYPALPVHVFGLRTAIYW